MSYEPTRQSFNSPHVFFKLQDYELKTGSMIFALIHKKNGNEVGGIKWFDRANQYVFYPRPGVVYDWMLLRDISNACNDLTQEHFVRLKTRN